MKKSYLYLLTAIIYIVTSVSLSSQSSENFGEYRTYQENFLEDFDIMSEENGCCGNETIEDISFGYNISAALYAHSLIQAARRRALNNWFNRQHNIIKEEIEKQLGQKFSNFPDARAALFKNYERIIVSKNVAGVYNEYASKVRVKTDVKNKSIRNLKLLKLRENEIKAGNINNSLYGNLQYNGILLKEITTINRIKTLTSSEITIFKNNEWRLHNDIHIHSKLRYDIARNRE